MKVVYILVSSESDYYAEQTLVSMCSLKRYNPSAEVYLLADNGTLGRLNGSRAFVKDYADKIVEITLGQKYKSIQKSRFIKTSLPKYVDGDFLYIDNDTVVTGPLDDLEDYKCDVGAVFNQHRDDWNNDGVHPQLRQYYEVTGTHPDDDDKISHYYNGGVILVRNTQTAKDFFDLWHNLWIYSSTKLGFHKDQPDMWRANYQVGNLIKDLPGCYNMQSIYPKRSIIFLNDCRIFHYFSSNMKLLPRLSFKNEASLQLVRDNGITGEIEQRITNIRVEYIDNVTFLANINVEIEHEPYFLLCRKILSWFPFLNSIANVIYKIKKKMRDQ
ncbi:MAG: hypothetical protein J1F05_05630 [Muribaculaceae bacterium]|nr:hypothetical protein [Muribaculaceae bacterium]